MNLCFIRPTVDFAMQPTNRKNVLFKLLWENFIDVISIIANVV
jgi:hypothetical protein